VLLPDRETCPDNTGAKVQKVWELAKKVEEKIGGNGKMLNYVRQYRRAEVVADEYM
jgi:hypothetical protein